MTTFTEEKKKYIKFEVVNGEVTEEIYVRKKTRSQRLLEKKSFKF